jgi:hypothetical protein
MKELSTIPFRSLIGGPLTAAIEAQSQAAVASVKFIKDVGFDDDNLVRNLTFQWQGPNDETQKLSVPLLTVVPIPFIRIDDMSIAFKASISQSRETEESAKESVDKSLKVSASARWLFAKASLEGSISSKKDSESSKSSKYSVEYTIDVNVHAVQDDMPGGMAKILNILKDSITTEQTGGKPPVKK